VTEWIFIILIFNRLGLHVHVCQGCQNELTYTIICTVEPVIKG